MDSARRLRCIKFHVKESNKKAPTQKRVGAKKWQRHTLPQFNAVPSALMSLTSLFGMGRGGPHRYSHLKSYSDLADTKRLT